jgi:hypothetical protein
MKYEGGGQDACVPHAMLCYAMLCYVVGRVVGI